MIVQVYGLNLLPGAGELLSQCVDDLDENGRAPIESSWQDILQSLWKLSQETRGLASELSRQRDPEGLHGYEGTSILRRPTGRAG